MVGYVQNELAGEVRHVHLVKEPDGTQRVCERG